MHGRLILGIAILTTVISIGCGGGSGMNRNVAAGELAISPATLNFGNVAVGARKGQDVALTAGDSSIRVASAEWNGEGYSVSGIVFPVTVPAAQSVPFTVTFAPQAAGSASGSIVFGSNATNSPGTETLTGSGGTQGPQHSVALSWNPSTSQVIGYNVYRSTLSGGPYAKLTTATDANTAYTDSSVQSGTTYYYVATSVDSSGDESVDSVEVSALIP